jgi:EAL domain-containing protein (putative c-di-GMP-specific phosphodiesterase class I)
LPLDELKLAGAFLAGVRSGDPGSVDARVMATLVDLAHALGLSVTAEGVETAEQDRLVRGLGCDVGQGWFYAHPGTPETLHAWRSA